MSGLLASNVDDNLSPTSPTKSHDLRLDHATEKFAAASTMAATSPATLDAIQQIDCREAWGRMSAEARAEIGSLAIRRALLSLAACTFEGNIVYLDAEHRDRADDLGMAVSDEQTGILWDALPDLFGIFPCEEHPNGTDPFWATPMQREDEVTLEISWGEEPDGTAGSTDALSASCAGHAESPTECVEVSERTKCPDGLPGPKQRETLE